MTRGNAPGVGSVAVLAIRGAAPEVLLLRRSASAAGLGGFDVLPGGALQADVRPEEAAARWLAQQTGLHATELQTVGWWDAPPYSPADGTVQFFLAEMPAASEPGPGSDGFAAARWVPARQALQQWAEGSIRLTGPVPQLLQALLQHGPDPAQLGAIGPQDAFSRWLEMHEGITILPVLTPTLPPATHTNAYALGTQEFVLIEPASPWPEEQKVLWDYVHARLDRGQRCVAIVLTHHHPDHVGGVEALRERLDAPVWMHAATSRLLRGRIAADRLLEEGETLELEELSGRPRRRLRVHHTPGHAPGHLCLVDDRTGAAVVGDMVASVGTILIDPQDGDMIQYLESLARMGTLGMRTLLPAHGGPLCDPQQVLQHYIRHRLMRERKVVAALEQQSRAASIEELVPHAYDDTPAALYPLAARALESHLRKLVQEQLVHSPEPDRYVLRRR